jgi:hypothetical protein
MQQFAAAWLDRRTRSGPKSLFNLQEVVIEVEACALSVPDSS